MIKKTFIFSKNLAAFLTVERMVTTVKNLEQLALQTKVNYTVVQNSSYHEYFKVSLFLFSVNII